MERLHCGVDIGTTNLKVVLVDGAGRCVARGTAPTPRVPDGGRVATDAAGLVGLLEAMIAAAWRDAGRPGPLASIATTGVGEDGIGVTADLVPTGLSLPWFDDRAAVQAGAFDPASPDTLRAGLAVDPSRTAAKWLWLRQNRPDELAAAHAWLALTDYPAAIWSGRAFMSETLAARTACFDIYGRNWIAGLLERAGAPPLPPVVAAGTAIGTVRHGALTAGGLADASTLVVAGGHDHPVAASAIRGLDQRGRIDSLGTANLVYCEAERAAPGLDPYLAFSVPVRGGRGVACLGVFELAAALAPLGDLTGFLASPSLPGSPSPRLPPPTAAGIAASGDRRAALEACTLFARRMLEAADEAGAPPGAIHATGGWSRSRALVELRASVFGTPVTVIDEPELAAVAAALIGAEGAGAPAPLAAAGRSHVVEPVPAWAQAYDAVHAEYRPRLDAMVAAEAERTQLHAGG